MVFYLKDHHHIFPFKSRIQNTEILHNRIHFITLIFGHSNLHPVKASGFNIESINTPIRAEGLKDLQYATAQIQKMTDEMDSYHDDMDSKK